MSVFLRMSFTVIEWKALSVKPMQYIVMFSFCRMSSMCRFWLLQLEPDMQESSYNISTKSMNSYKATKPERLWCDLTLSDANHICFWLLCHISKLKNSVKFDCQITTLHVKYLQASIHQKSRKRNLKMPSWNWLPTRHVLNAFSTHSRHSHPLEVVPKCTPSPTCLAAWSAPPGIRWSRWGPPIRTSLGHLNTSLKAMISGFWDLKKIQDRYNNDNNHTKNGHRCDKSQVITISNAAFYLSELLLPIDDPRGVVLNLLISTNRKLPSILWGALNKGRHLQLHQTHQTHQKSEKFWMNVLGSSSTWEFMTLLSTKCRMPTSLICYFIYYYFTFSLTKNHASTASLPNDSRCSWQWGHHHAV